MNAILTVLTLLSVSHILCVNLWTVTHYTRMETSDLWQRTIIKHRLMFPVHKIQQPISSSSLKENLSISSTQQFNVPQCYQSVAWVGSSVLACFWLICEGSLCKEEDVTANGDTLLLLSKENSSLLPYIFFSGFPEDRQEDMQESEVRVMLSETGV